MLLAAMATAGTGCDCCCKEDPGFIEFDFSIRTETCLGEPTKFASIRGSKDTTYVTFLVESTGQCGIQLDKGMIDPILTNKGGTASSTVPFGGTGVSSLSWRCYSASMESTFIDSYCAGRIQLFRKNRHECVTRWGEKDSLLLTRYNTGGYRDSCNHQVSFHKHQNETNRPQKIIVRANSAGTCTFHVWMKTGFDFYGPPYFRASPTLDSLIAPSNLPPGEMSRAEMTVPPKTTVWFYAGCLDDTPPGGDFCAGTVELYIKD